MSVYVGIDVHRKRSQVAVIDSGGEVLANRNVPNGTETILGVIGGLPPGTPAAFEAAFGWGGLLELLEDYGFHPHLGHPLQCKAIPPARLKNDKGRCPHPRAAPSPPLAALVLPAEVGGITRFGSARKLASWAGLPPTVRGSGRTVRHGHISKQGSAWVRWILCEAAQTAKRHPDFAPATRPSPAAAARRS